MITDLSSAQADPQRIGEIVQAEWSIENKIHYVRNVTFGEDASGPATGRRTWSR
ncbi:hypothetical protein [Streptomyces sp. NPDC005795]|uniref:hypothetical protein n=1 Tax=Streptomyces sp. NPDC005795 TaxID=3154677 RepID=UPI00341001E0